MSELPTAPFPRTVLRDQVRELVMARIISGEYPSGSRIVESQLAQELGVSQAPVREALRDLDALRFIETTPYKGARVRKVAVEELAEIYPVRAALEEVAATLAVERLSRTRLERLSEQLLGCLDEMRESARRGEVHAQLVADARFHRIIVEAAANAPLLQVWSSLRIEASTLMTVIRTGDNLSDIVETHVPLVHALGAGDALAAGRAFRGHIEQFGHRVTDLVRAADAAAPA